MNAIDTNVLVRLIVRDDREQAVVADEFVARGGWVSLLVLAETTWVLSAIYKLDATKIATAVEMLLSHEQLAIQDRPTAVAALEAFKATPKLGFSDCLILETARAAGHTPLGTFDRKLGAQAGAKRL